MKNLLLIDDEIDLVESLQEFLTLENKLFTTQIAFSVDSAKVLIKENNFDLIITDIRMPEKSGLELLVFLKNIEYMGEIMVMTAYGDSEIKSHIRTLGSAKIIAKPFKFDWFKDMLIDIFKKKGFSGTIDSIDLTTLLQVIHLEKKTTGIEIKIDKETGFLYFIDGELINAEFRGFSGEEAAFKLIGLNSGHFNLVKNRRSLKTRINIPFMSFLLGVMKNVDELVEKKINTNPKKKKKKIKDSLLSNFQKIIGYKWIVFFNNEEEVLLMDNKNETEVKQCISMFSNLLDNAEFVFQELDHGNIEFVLIQMQKGIFLFSEIKKNEIRMIMNFEINADLDTAKFIIRKIVNQIDDFIT